MTRLIDADEIKKVINEKYLIVVAEELNRLIDNAPTVITNGEYEALCKITDQEFEHSNGFWVETPKGKKIYFEKARPKGEWIYERPNGKTYSDFVFCSVCQKPNGFYITEFCPHCGADMRKGETE